MVFCLAGSTSFFATKFFSSADETAPVTSKSISANIDSIKTDKPEATPSIVQSSNVTKPASAQDKPSKPMDLYVIKQGETLFAVASANGVTATQLTEANGITDPNKIQAGQTIIIPKGGQVSFQLDNTRATSLQKEVDGGKYQFRLSPEDTARSDAPTAYGLTVADSYILKTSNKDAGTAEIQASREGKSYLIKLGQPIIKGDKGIWAIELIEPA